MPKVDHPLYGTLNLLILRTLEGKSLHGLEILRTIEAAAGEDLRIEEGALYPALHRLERDGLLESEWGLSEQRRRARYYRLTRAGREHLEREASGWLRHADAVARVLGAGRFGAKP
jgi:transcriptional regulator